MLNNKKNNVDRKGVSEIIARYLVLLAIVLLFTKIEIIYNFFFILTLEPLKWILGALYTLTSYGEIIYLDNITIEIIPACVAFSAYILLLILNLTTHMKIAKRVLSVIFSFLLLLVINILRIFLLSVLVVNAYSGFEIVHKVMWYALSIVIVVGIWFLTLKIFKIKEIPVYSDIKKVIKNVK